MDSEETNVMKEKPSARAYSIIAQKGLQTPVRASDLRVDRVAHKSASNRPQAKGRRGVIHARDR
jgi:hypothetical protein